MVAVDWQFQQGMVYEQYKNGDDMGLIKTKIMLANPRDPELKPLQVTAMADTGALHLCVPEHVAVQLQLQELDRREVTVADGSKRACAYVGPVEVKFQNRACYTGALVLGDEVLLGAVPMEDMDLVLSPARRAITVNPDTPNLAGSVVKAVKKQS